MPGTIITEEWKAFTPGVCMLIGSSKRFWRVLEYSPETDTALVIADRPIAGLPLNSELKLITWAECSLRRWLNEDFLKSEFTAEEVGAILPVRVSTANNPRYGTKGGEDCFDRVFILDSDEAGALFSSDEDRATPCTWWLRNPGRGNRFFACVDHYGTIRAIGNSVDSVSYSARPVMKLNLGSGIFSGRLRRDAEGRITQVLEPRLLIEDGRLVSSRLGIEELTVPAFVTEIAEDCFNSCGRLKAVRFEGIIEKVDESAFKNCRSISEADISPEAFARLPYRVKDCLIKKETISAFLDGLKEMGENTRLAVISMLNTPGVTERFILELITKDNSVGLGRLLDSLESPLSPEEIARYSELADSTAEVKLLFMDYRSKNRKNPSDEFELEW